MAVMGVVGCPVTKEPVQLCSSVLCGPHIGPAEEASVHHQNLGGGKKLSCDSFLGK